jgi:hypothetical protein
VQLGRIAAAAGKVAFDNSLSTGLPPSRPQPSIGGWGELGSTNLSQVSDLTEIGLHGYFTISALAYILGIRFPIDTNMKLPMALNKIPIDLSQTRDGTVLEFVDFTNGHWEHTCPCQHKDIPIIVNVGSFGQLGVFGDGTSRGNSRFVIDVSVGLGLPTNCASSPTTRLLRGKPSSLNLFSVCDTVNQRLR